MRKLSMRISASILCLAIMAFTPSLTSAEDKGTTAISIGAEITGEPDHPAGDNNVAVGSSTLIINGNDNSAQSYGALVIGGSGNTSIGINAMTLEGTGLQAAGYGAIAGRGNNNTAIGNHAYAGGTPDIPGLNSSNSNVAIGYYSGAYGGNSVAMGAGATAIANNSVALGAGSVAYENNTVSVGNIGEERKITNLAPGYYNTDAVNMSQLRRLDSKVDRVGSIAMAMSGLAPLPYDPKEPTLYSAAYGTYNGTGAVALGVFHYTKPSVMYNMAVAMSDDKWEKAARFGVTWRTGGAKPKPLTPTNVKKDDEKTTIQSRIKTILANGVDAK